MTRQANVERMVIGALNVWRTYLRNMIDECGGLLPFIGNLVLAFPEFGKVCSSNALMRRWQGLVSGDVAPAFHEAVIVMSLYTRVFGNEDENLDDIFKTLETGTEAFSSIVNG